MKIARQLPQRLANISRRRLLIGSGVGAGLLLAWGVWPRSYRHNLLARPGEMIFNAFLKIDEAGLVTVIVPQAEMGQGVYTSLPQILADELGADWRTIAVEPAPINPLYANDFLLREQAEKNLPDMLQGMGQWTAREIAVRSEMMMTAGSSSIRGFATRFREAGAMARTLLCMAAAERWDADWQACDTAGGFVILGAPDASQNRPQDRLRFGELATLAASFEPPKDIPLREPKSRRLVGTSVPRLDLPSKVDGTAQFAADIRLPNMAFASVRHPPLGGGTLHKFDRQAAQTVPDVRLLVDHPMFIAAIGESWWAADRALQLANIQWKVDQPGLNDEAITQRLKAALDEADGARVLTRGNGDDVTDNPGVFAAEYRVAPAPHAAIEPLTATARFENDRMEVWMPTQSPGIARAAIAWACNIDDNRVTVHPMLVGGGFGRKLDHDAGVEAAILAIKAKRPIQLTWPRAQDLGLNRCRPPAIARMRAQIEPNSGIPLAWQAQIACPATSREVMERLGPGMAWLIDGDAPNAFDVDGAMPPYAVPSVAIDHHPTDIGIPTSIWRGMAHSYTAFFTESFIDELAHSRKMDPMSYRMQMLGNQTRLAQCLALVASYAGWQGGAMGSGQGIACHSSFGSHVAMVADVHVAEDQRIIVDRITAVVDCGQIVHPDIVRQQIEGGIIWGLATALGNAMSYDKGKAMTENLAALRLPQLANSPEIITHLIASPHPSGGVGEIAVPPVAPAIANALYALNGLRARHLPLTD